MKNKLLLILFMFILIINIFCLSSFGFELTYKENTIELPSFFDEYKNILIFKDLDHSTRVSEYFCVYLSNFDFYYRLSPIASSYEFYSSEGNFKYFHYFVDPATSRATFFGFKDLSKLSLDYFSETSGIFSSVFSGLTQEDIIYINFNVYDSPDKENLVFQGAPVTVEQVTIPTITQVEEIPQVMSKVLEMIIPVGLIVLSIGLLIYLVRLVILRAT